jgi:Flp pilus assembly protein TadG
MRHTRSRIGNERGATLVFVAMLLVALFGLFSVAVDVGMWLNTRGEAQRVADAAALAGAGIYMYNEGDPDRPADMVAAADSAARDFAGRNYVGTTVLDADLDSPGSPGPYPCSTGGDVTVCVRPDSQLVRVAVRGRRPSIFSFMVGADSLPVAARAAARVVQAGAASCVKPFAIPDMWRESTQDNSPANRVWDFDRGAGCNGRNCAQPEVWSFDPAAGDVYDREQYGYGTGYRNDRVDWRSQRHTADYGRRVPIKIQSAQDVNVASYWYPWVIPGSNNRGMQAVVDNIGTCVNRAEIGEQVEQYGTETKNGNGPQPIYRAMQDLVALDPDPYWDESTNTVVYPAGSTSPYKGDWRSSPRVITIAVFNPEDMAPGKNYMEFVDFVQLFLEDPDREYASVNQGHKRPITGRMIHYVAGETGPESGNLVRILQLVQ